MKVELLFYWYTFQIYKSPNRLIFSSIAIPILSKAFQYTNFRRCNEIDNQISLCGRSYIRLYHFDTFCDIRITDEKNSIDIENMINRFLRKASSF